MSAFPDDGIAHHVQYETKVSSMDGGYIYSGGVRKGLLDDSFGGSGEKLNNHKGVYITIKLE